MGQLTGLRHDDSLTVAVLKLRNRARQQAVSGPVLNFRYPQQSTVTRRSYFFSPRNQQTSPFSQLDSQNHVLS